MLIENSVNAIGVSKPELSRRLSAQHIKLDGDTRANADHSV